MSECTRRGGRLNTKARWVFTYMTCRIDFIVRDFAHRYDILRRDLPNIIESEVKLAFVIFIYTACLFDFPVSEKCVSKIL